MTAPECKPPPGTPEYQECWLQQTDKIGRHRTYALWQWRIGCWWAFGTSEPWTVHDMTNYLWRFHSLATPPEEPK
jgi:hypothetical protein